MNITTELVGEPDAPTPLCERQAEQNLEITYSWQLRRQMRALNGFFNAGGFEQQSYKTYIGKLAKGYDWMSAQISDAVMEGIVQCAKVNHGDWLRWSGWARAYSMLSASLFIGVLSHSGAVLGATVAGDELLQWARNGAIIDDGDGYAAPGLGQSTPAPRANLFLDASERKNAAGWIPREPQIVTVLAPSIFINPWVITGGGAIDGQRSESTISCDFSNGTTLRVPPYPMNSISADNNGGGVVLAGPPLNDGGDSNMAIPSATCTIQLRLVITGVTSSSELSWNSDAGILLRIQTDAGRNPGNFDPGTSWEWNATSTSSTTPMRIPHPTPATCTWAGQPAPTDFGNLRYEQSPPANDDHVGGTINVGVSCINSSETPIATNATVSAWSDHAIPDGSAIGFADAPGLRVRLMAPVQPVPGVILGDGQNYGLPFIVGPNAGDARPLWAWSLPGQTGAIATNDFPIIPVLQSTSADWGSFGPKTTTVTLTLTTQ